MDKLIEERGIRAVGFDLDKTLYKPNEKVTQVIEEYAIKKSSEILNMPIKNVKKIYDNAYKRKKSVRRTLLELGVEDAATIAQESVEQANMAQYLERDERLVKMFNKLHEVYELFLITSSKKDDAVAKLTKLGLGKSDFSVRQYGKSTFSREDGTAFLYVADKLNLELEQMMFVGDREKVDIVPAHDGGIVTALVNGEPNMTTVADFRLNEIYDLENILIR